MFKQFALDKTGQVIYYEDYVARLVEENERHLDYLLRGYESFKPSMGKWIILFLDFTFKILKYHLTF